MSYVNIRELIGGFVGKTITDITQQDEDEFAEHKQSFIMLMFSDGSYLKFIIGDDGFHWCDESGDEKIAEPESE